MTTATNTVARVAAAVAGLGLVAMSFAPLANAQTATTATTTTTTTTTATFTRDLTVGSTGADVTALQTWLIAKGFSIPAGATGYFGAQTKAALAAFQAANAITPAAGYFGPITRAKVASMGSGTTTTSTVPGCMPGAAFSSTTGQACGSTTTTTTTTTGLSGGEANLTNYDLRTGNDLGEGDTNTEIATAKFDVDGGDVNVQRVRLTVQATDHTSSASTNPWKYFSKLSVYNGSTKIGSVDAGSRDAWDSNSTDIDLNSSGANSYSIDITTNGVVKDGATAQLSIRADAQDTIDTVNEDQSFDLAIKSQDLRAVDGAGIQEYTGKDTDHVSVGFNSSNISSSDVSVRESSDDPNAGTLVADNTNSTNDLSVFKFQIKNNSDQDVLLNNLDVTANVSSTSLALSHIVRRATLTVDGHDYDATISGTGTSGLLAFDFGNDDVTVSSNDTMDFELNIDLLAASGHYASGTSLTFSVIGAQVDAEGFDTGDNATVGGTANGNKQTVVLNGGINVEGNSNSAQTGTTGGNTPDNYGTFTLKFDVTAEGDDVYVPKAISTSAGSTTAGVVIDPNLSTTATGTTTASLTSTADVDSTRSDFYVVHDGDTETFTASVTVNPTSSNYYQVGLDMVRFSTNADGSGLNTLDTDQTDSQFQTNPLYITAP
ncbi:MAG: peptidoglycan-binding protein [Patescibacteria group bacterium]